jgi:hypothetical protein
MGYLLRGGPQDGEYVLEIPEGYVAREINAGVVRREGESPVRRASWQGDLNEAERIIKNQGYGPSGDL